LGTHAKNDLRVRATRPKQPVPSPTTIGKKGLQEKNKCKKDVIFARKAPCGSLGKAKETPGEGVLLILIKKIRRTEKRLLPVVEKNEKVIDMR